MWMRTCLEPSEVANNYGCLITQYANNRHQTCLLHRLWGLRYSGYDHPTIESSAYSDNQLDVSKIKVGAKIRLLTKTSNFSHTLVHDGHRTSIQFSKTNCKVFEAEQEKARFLTVTKGE